MMKNYFWGYYFKCQSEAHTLAVIPALHCSGKARSCSIQLITREHNWGLTFPYDDFQKHGHAVAIGPNHFGPQGLQLQMEAPGLAVRGQLYFGPLQPIRYDIMGPFSCVPFLECRHSIFSMGHTVNGNLRINGRDFPFSNGRGYWEGDRGGSFPRRYAWTHCFFTEGSLMLSVAEIPLGIFRFTGLIGVISWQGREYRLATYLGARVLRLQAGEIIVRQGPYLLTVRLLEPAPRPLLAPNAGAMTRTIRESAACRASYLFQKNGAALFQFETDSASFEYEYPI